MRKFFVLIAFLLICSSISNIESIYATENGKDVSIFINSNDNEQYSKQFDANVTINFNKKNLYNENVYLSYHVYDDSGKEILWEGQRYPISIESDGKASVEVSVDLSLDSALTNSHKSNIKFDLVDQKNAYWFSTNSEISFSSDTIIFDDSFWKKFNGTLSSSISNNPIIFSVNLLCLLIFIIALYKIKRSQLLYN